MVRSGKMRCLCNVDGEGEAELVIVSMGKFTSLAKNGFMQEDLARISDTPQSCGYLLQHSLLQILKLVLPDVPQLENAKNVHTRNHRRQPPSMIEIRLVFK